MKRKLARYGLAYLVVDLVVTIALIVLGSLR